MTVARRLGARVGLGAVAVGLTVVLGLGCRARGSHAPDSAPAALRAPSRGDAERVQWERARQLLCADVGESACDEACPVAAPLPEYRDCLLGRRFADDPEALALARALSAKTGALLGLEPSASIEGYRGEQVDITPALPLHDDRGHLEWLHAGFDATAAFVRALSAAAPKEVVFRPFPRELRFYQTAERSYPSAYAQAGAVAYNLRGALHTSARDVREVLVHELFHLNDEEHGNWSATTLGPLFDDIVERCGDDHACLTTFAPHDTVVPNGTYYAFDPRTREVREYAAELALRYFREHEAILAGQEPLAPPFKCLAEENQTAWTRLADEFFGGVDLSPGCEAQPAEADSEET